MSSEKRLLTKKEINSLLSFIKPMKSIPEETAQSIVDYNKDKLRQQLVSTLIYPEMIPKLKKMLRKQYVKTCIQPGESVGVIGAQSIGEKQTQSTLNSVDWTDEVLYSYNDKTYVQPIGEMIDYLLDKNKSKVLIAQKNKTEYLRLEDGYYIPSGDENGMNEWLKIEAVTRHLPNGKLVHIKTKSGREVKASKCKSFLVWNGNKFEDTLGSEVKVGDILPTSKYLPKHKIKKHVTFRYGKTVTLNLREGFGFFIGIYLANGFYSKTSIGLCINDVKTIKKITDWCNKININCKVIKENSSHQSLKICSKTLTKIIKNIIGIKKHKNIPKFAFNAPDTFIKGLIDGYFSGYCEINRWNGLIYVNGTKQVIIGMSLLLSYFGIFTKTRNIFDYYSLEIKNIFSKKFSEIFQLTDTIKQQCLTIISNFNDAKIPSEYPEDRHVYFDPIISIEEVDATNGVVYDFTVEKTRNFNLFNGLVVKDTFHKAGSSETTVTTGVPRVEELLNARKIPRSINCFIYFTEGNNNIQELRDTIGHSLVELTFKKITKSYEIHVDKKPEKWYESFKILYNDNFTKYTDCISLQLDMDILYEYKLDMEHISNLLCSEYSDMTCVFSPNTIGQFDIFVDTENIELGEKRVAYIDSDEAVFIYLEEVVQPILEEIILCGIPEVKTIYFNRDDDNWMVETEGCNFKQILGHPSVDKIRTFSNNMWDIYRTLGVEAARQFLIEEFMNIMSGINKCHVQLIVDRMTFTGSISSISRYTMRHEGTGPLGRVSFEETFDNLLKAGVYGQEDSITGVSASIICGNISKIGTGKCDILLDLDKLPISVL